MVGWTVVRNSSRSGKHGISFDGQRKLGNTARFAVGNLEGFDPSSDMVDEHEMLEIDRWALVAVNSIVVDVRDAYEAYDFHSVYQSLHQFCTVTLSARYFDIIKDRLYTFAPKNKARRSAQTALYRIADALARMLAPMLVFTADEIWENLPQNSGRAASVHLALYPEAQGVLYTGLLARWEAIFKVREEVLRELEAQRVAKVIGSSLDAKVKLSVSWAIYNLLKAYQVNNEVRYLFIVSQTELFQADLRPVDGVSTGTAPLIDVEVDRAEGQKCE